MNRNTSEKKRKVSPVPKEQTTSVHLGKINPKMLLDKSELNIPIDYEETKTPNYYIGEVFGYEARNIIEDFDLSYNVGTCLSYILRAKRKHDTQVECIQKAINHLEFELDKLKR
tara:strand:+ start:659 stop:1000 length:342 start_codon:yes stop_codon:yes gene_type:complete